MLIVNQSETVTFQVENSSLLVDEPVKLDFSACPEDVIHIEPDSRVIVLPSTEAFSLTFFATGGVVIEIYRAIFQLLAQSSSAISFKQAHFSRHILVFSK